LSPVTPDVLPAPHRLRRRRDFGVATRRGRRAGSSTVVAHLALPASGAGTGPGTGAVADRHQPGRPPAASADVPDSPSATASPARVGFVVSGAVGPAVVRNRVRRRLRHLAAEQVRRLPDGTLLVVRALPSAAGATTAQLAADLHAVLTRLTANPQVNRSVDVQA
jgi:ribonuclease P protein component